MNKELYIRKLEELFIEEYIKYKVNYPQSEVGQEAFLSIVSYIGVLRIIPEGKVSFISATKAFLGILIYMYSKAKDEISFEINSLQINPKEKNILLKRYDELAFLGASTIYIKNMVNMSLPIDDFIMEVAIAENSANKKVTSDPDDKEYLKKFHCRKVDILMLEKIIGKHPIFDDIMGKT